MINQETNCQNCIHYDVCYMKKHCNDMEKQPRGFSCKNFLSKENILQTRIPIGATVYRLTATSVDVPIKINGEILYRKGKRWSVTHFQYDWMNAIIDSQKNAERLKDEYFFNKDDALAERDRRNAKI